jgi:hypothetical protein
MSRSTIFDRLEYLRVDQYGVDPLSSAIYPALHRLPVYLQRYVTDDEAGNPPLISFRVYSSATVDLWWAVMEYNGIISSKQIVAGLFMRFPDYGALLQLLQNVQRSRVLVGVTGVSNTGQVISSARTLKL